MEIPQCFYRISVKGLLLDETRTKFLVVREDNGRWELPGGGIDHGESPQECLRREIKEEMGLETTFVADNPSFFLVCEKDSVERKWVANVLYEIRLADLNFTPSAECVEVRFVKPEEALTLNAFSNVYELAKLFAASLGR
ncbi:MAG: NUDIX hydrolase [bacterium]|nr:NUDIX hydrolase [bacterium]